MAMMFCQRGSAANAVTQKSAAINTVMVIPTIFSFTELLFIDGLFLNNPYNEGKWLQI